jgi:hypothetical protein
MLMYRKRLEALASGSTSAELQERFKIWPLLLLCNAIADRCFKYTNVCYNSAEDTEYASQFTIVSSPTVDKT